MNEKQKKYSLYFLFIILIKLINIGNKILTSDVLLPANTEIIFLLIINNLINLFYFFHLFSSKGCPVNVEFIFSLSKYFFSKEIIIKYDLKIFLIF